MGLDRKITLLISDKNEMQIKNERCIQILKQMGWLKSLCQAAPLSKESNVKVSRRRQEADNTGWRAGNSIQN